MDDQRRSEHSERRPRPRQRGFDPRVVSVGLARGRRVRRIGVRLHHAKRRVRHARSRSGDLHRVRSHAVVGGRRSQRRTGTPPISTSARTAASTSVPISRCRAISSATIRSPSRVSSRMTSRTRNSCPYTLAIHAGRDEDGQEHNPHAHLMFSERRNDGIERSREQWFRRANSAHPERGGAPKSRTFHGRKWVEQAREQWAAKMNATLERHGRSDRRRSPQLCAPGYRS